MLDIQPVMSSTHIPHTLRIAPPPPPTPPHTINMLDCLVISSCDLFVVAVWAVTDSMCDGEHNLVVIPQHDTIPVNYFVFFNDKVEYIDIQIHTNVFPYTQFDGSFP